MRLFVAWVASPAAVQDLRNALSTQQVRDAGAAIRWSPAEDWHVTLAFLGEIDPERLPAVVRATATAARAGAPFTAALVGAGCFPRAGRATTVWAGIDTAGTVASTDLADRLRDALEVNRFAVDERAFRAHLTLGRCRPTDLRPAVDMLAEYRGPRFDVTEITVFQSHLGRAARPRYEPLARYPLAGAARIHAAGL
jgi:2'-5' RNA ligase